MELAGRGEEQKRPNWIRASSDRTALVILRRSLRSMFALKRTVQYCVLFLQANLLDFEGVLCFDFFQRAITVTFPILRPWRFG